MNTNHSPARIGVVTVSDRASAGTYEDRGGPAITSYLMEHLSSPWLPIARLVPDDPMCVATLIELPMRRLLPHRDDRWHGPAPRDITPEAAESVCDKMMPGFGELMRSTSLRGANGRLLRPEHCGSSLIINCQATFGNCRIS